MDIKTKKPSVMISSLAMTKINYWVQASNVEISGLGKCTYNKQQNSFYVTDVFLLEQENGPTTTDIDATAAAKLLYETKDMEGHLNFWWHSHVNMGVFWSGTDTSTIKEFGDQGFCLATVFNKKREMRSAVYYKGSDFSPPVFLDELPTQEYFQIDEEIIKKCKEEMDAKCKTKTYIIESYNGDYNRGKQKKGKKKTSTPKISGGKTSTKIISQENLGFEYSGTKFNWDRLVRGQDSYSGFTFRSTLNPQYREHGSIHPTMYSIWDDNIKSWISIQSFVRTNPSDAYGVIYRQPFTQHDWLKMCTIYEIIFKNPPVELQDIEEFFQDVMDYSTSEFWNTNGRELCQDKAHEEFTKNFNILVALHKQRKVGA